MGRLGSLRTVKDDQPVARKEAKPPIPVDSDSAGQLQRCVIIQKDEKGYGLTVSGDNPVFVQSVKPDGAASKAGVQQGDKIIKVNGTSALSLNHIEVVNLIKSGSYVALTLLGKSQGQIKAMESKENSSSSHRITAPRPVDHEKERNMRQQSIRTIEKMLILQQEECIRARKIYAKSPSEKNKEELNEKERTVNTLETRLRQLQSEFPSDFVELGLPDLSSGRLPGGSKHIKHGSVPASIYKTRDLVDIRDINVSRSKSDASSKASQVVAGETLGSSHSQLPPGYQQRDNTKERTSLTVGSPDTSGILDSPHASPSNSPTPVHLADMSSSNPDADRCGTEDGGTAAIMTMEEDDDDEVPTDEAENRLPFGNFEEVEKRNAYLSILLHYLISNDDPSALFFYIISDIYSSANGSSKELRKWAYEIYSTFLIQNAPLKVTIDENLVKIIDDVLNSKTDKEENLRSLFHDAKHDVRSAVNLMLNDFRNKQKLGLGNFYGVDELELDMDKSQEMKIIENYLVPHLESFTEEKAKCARDQALGWALATYLRHIGVTKLSYHSSVLDRVHSFVMKERKEKGIKLPGTKSKTKAYRNHQFVPQHYYQLTDCTVCSSPVWGVGFQGYQCSNCEWNVHKHCIESIDILCPQGRKKRTSGLMDKWGRKPSNTNAPHINQRRESCSPTQSGSSGVSGADEDVDSGFHSVNSIVKRFEKSPGENDDERHKRATDLGRSESLKDRPDQKGDRRTRRAKSDVDMDENTIKVLNNSGSSSTSSLHSARKISDKFFGSSDSPCNSNDADNEDPMVDDSDLEVEPELPHLTKVISEDLLRKMKPKEKKRQEVINELFYTERAHLRNMKILDKLFRKPMMQREYISQNLIDSLFPNLEELIKLHKSMNEEMKTRRKEHPVISGVGDILLRRFDGEAGEHFKKNCAIFCRNQSSALESLRLKQRKDQKFAQFLMESESSIMCRRLQLKDLIPAEMQRLTKYHLLIDNLLKYTTTSTEEYAMLEKINRLSKRILEYVNLAVQECENSHRLYELQRRLDKRPLENIPEFEEFKNFSLTDYKLIHEGFLTWHVNQTRNKNIDVHVVLLDKYLVFLQKQDDRLVLKCHDTAILVGGQGTDMRCKFTHRPILDIDKVLTRNVATNKKGFFVVYTSSKGPQIYELTAPSIEDQKKWFKCIQSAVDTYDKKMKSNTTVTASSTVSTPTTTNSTSITPTLTATTTTTATTAAVTATTTATTTPTTTTTTHSTTEAQRKIDSIGTDQLQPDTGGLKDKDVVEHLGQLTDERLNVEKADEAHQPEAHFAGPEDVIISDVAIARAESVQSPIEKLRQNEELVRKMLKDREKIIAELLNIPFDDYDHIVEMASEKAMGEKRRQQQQQQQQQFVDLQEVILACSDHSKELLEIMITTLPSHGLVANSTTTPDLHPTTDSLSAVATKGDNPQVAIPIPYSKLQDMNNKLNSLVTNMLSVIHDDERIRLREELKLAQEQVQQLLEAKRLMSAGTASMPSSLTMSASSRPHSMISTTSSASEQYEEPLPDPVDMAELKGPKETPTSSQPTPDQQMCDKNNSQQSTTKDSAESDNDFFQDVSSSLTEMPSVKPDAENDDQVPETSCESESCNTEEVKEQADNCSTTLADCDSIPHLNLCDDMESVYDMPDDTKHQSGHMEPLKI
ncbi:rho guanine nucleotide exchange factor 12-like isoform X6 [Octopus sinensis]|uniref:Rho guanine nucleotide exchange factor 12-like isoform X6 n=1 Tax=Octopus sinensis TaxID=2607531 RepID=A0A7E6ETI4_9MOLL|nr:rho guanine nucleotide exchange factor 12-like isoform X6 [Octopus sinensis]